MLILNKNLLYQIRKKELEKIIMRFYEKQYPTFAQHWTEDAVNCYKRGCICKDCPILDLITSQKCQMKYAVIELVKKFGTP